MTNRNSNLFCLILIAICIGNIFVSWIFIRFLHYHSQNRSLNPNDYDVQVLTEEDYLKLSDPANQEVTLSDGILFGKTELWYSKVLPKYKLVNNSDQYVLVTIKGTAPFVQYWEFTIIPLVVILIIGLVINISGYRYKKQLIEEN